MDRTLAIVGHSMETVTMYAGQIKNLFSNMLRVEKYALNECPVKEEIHEDIVLVESYTVFDRIKNFLGDSETIFASRTISKVGLQKIMKLPSKTEAVFVDESVEMAKQMISALYQIGVRHVALTPMANDHLQSLDCKVIITLKDLKCGIDSERKVIRVGPSLLETSTIIDIGMRANLDHVLNNQNIKKSCRDIETVNVGLAEILAKTNKFESSLDILLSVFDQGVIAINSDGKIFSYNEKARTIMGLDSQNVIGENALTLFPKIPFKKTLKHIESKDKLEKINGYDVVITVNPIFHSERLLGAVAILKRFSEEETKQHVIRSQLIGRGYKAKYKFEDIVGESDTLNKCKSIALNMSKSDASILITGESGTGKEMFAQAIHNSSKRKEFQFVAVNCGALPESLLESELFGYEEGAFTGARKGGRPGLFELAHKGTLFMDEVGEIPLKLQKSLLRVLQEREVVRLGGGRVIHVDIRLIAATNRNLKKMVNDGNFREDLYYRLNVLPLSIPALRERKQDIKLLMDLFKKMFSWDFELTHAAKEILFSNSWKGNIRELKNCIEYISNMGIKKVDIQDLPFNFENNQEKEEVTSEPVKQTAFKLEEISGKKIQKYLCVLQELENGFSERKRLGRRSLSDIFKKRNLFISEQEIRGILIDMERLGLVEISAGRGGTVITELGRKVYVRFN